MVWTNLVMNDLVVFIHPLAVLWHSGGAINDGSRMKTTGSTPMETKQTDVISLGESLMLRRGHCSCHDACGACPALISSS